MHDNLNGRQADEKDRAVQERSLVGAAKSDVQLSSLSAAPRSRVHGCMNVDTLLKQGRLVEPAIDRKFQVVADQRSFFGSQELTRYIHFSKCLVIKLEPR